MWTDSSTIWFIIGFYGGFCVLPFLWSIVELLRKKEDAGGFVFIMLIVVICMGFMARSLYREHSVPPVITSCTELPNGMLEVQDSTRFCSWNKEETQVFTTILKPGTQLSLFDTCTICHKTLFDHEVKQKTVQNLMVDGMLPGAPWE